MRFISDKMLDYFYRVYKLKMLPSDSVIEENRYFSCQLYTINRAIR